MKYVSKFLVITLLLALSTLGYAEEPKKPLNMKVGENFYFEGDVSSDEGGSQEESMAEIKTTPFYETTWFITTASILVVAGASAAVLVLTEEEEQKGNTVVWNSK